MAGTEEVEVGEGATTARDGAGAWPAGALVHVTTRAAWEHALALGRYAPDSLAREGFVHLSAPGQLPGTLSRFFAGQTGLVVLVLDQAALEARAPGALRWEDPGEGQAFPHLYRALDPAEVREVRPLD